MATITFENGQKVNFEGNPTPQDIEEVARKLNVSKQAEPNIGTDNKILGGFIGNELFTPSQPKDFGIAGDIFRKTLGSQGLLGVAQLPGRIAETFISEQAKQGITKSRGQLAEVNLALIRKARTLPLGSTSRQQLEDLIQQNVRQLEGMSQQETELTQRQITPEQAIGTGVNAITTLAPFARGLGFISKPVGALQRIGQGAVIGAGAGAGTQMVENKPFEEVLGGTVAGGLLGAGTMGTFEVGRKLLSSVLTSIGETGLTFAIKPTNSAFEAGWKPETFAKYKITGNLQNQLKTTNQQLDTLSKQLEERLISTGNEGATINLNKVFADTVNQFRTNRLKLFGGQPKIDTALKGLGDEIATVLRAKETGGLPEVNLLVGNTIKRAAGAEGSWSFGHIDPEAVAREKVFSVFYSKMKEAIEKSAASTGDKGINALNAQIKELIPIANSLIRAIPAEARKAPASLSEILFLLGAVQNPSFAIGAGGLRALGSPRVGAWAIQAGTNLAQEKAQSTLGKIGQQAILRSLIR